MANERRENRHKALRSSSFFTSWCCSGTTTEHPQKGMLRKMTIITKLCLKNKQKRVDKGWKQQKTVRRRWGKRAASWHRRLCWDCSGAMVSWLQQMLLSLLSFRRQRGSRRQRGKSTWKVQNATKWQTDSQQKMSKQSSEMNWSNSCGWHMAGDGRRSTQGTTKAQRAQLSCEKIFHSILVQWTSKSHYMWLLTSPQKTQVIR